MLSDIEFSVWQKQMAPLLYDTFSHYNAPWPVQACRWGPVVDESSHKVTCRVFLAEQTDNSEPQKLVCSNVDICKPRVSSGSHITSWNDYSHCPYIREQKVIYHPGEINKIKELPQNVNILVTHTDSPDLYIWNTDIQPNRHNDKGSRTPNSVAELKLVGHEDDALFPLSVSTLSPTVASGGSDCMVLLWCVQDSMETSLARSASIVTSGYDELVLFWDTRAGLGPTCKIQQPHGRAAPDGSIRVWDTRKMCSPGDVLTAVDAHPGGVVHIEWHPTETGVFASGGEDRLITVWKCNGGSAESMPQPPAAFSSGTSSKAWTQAPMFQHPCHRRGKVADFHWSPHHSLPWTILSVSDDSADEEVGGGSIQVWRMSELIRRDESELIDELGKHGDFILKEHEAPPLTKIELQKDETSPSGAAEVNDADVAQALALGDVQAAKQRRTGLLGARPSMTASRLNLAILAEATTTTQVDDPGSGASEPQPTDELTDD
eukprot:gene16080-22219_t